MSQDTDTSNAVVRPPVALILAVAAGVAADRLYTLRFVPASVGGAWVGGGYFRDRPRACDLGDRNDPQGRHAGRDLQTDDGDRRERTLPLHAQPYLSRHGPWPDRARYRLRQFVDPRYAGAVLSRH